MDPLTAMAVIGIGTAKHGNGECLEALKWYNKGFLIRENVYQEEARPETASLYRVIALCNFALGKYRESLSNFYKQRDMFEELEKSGKIPPQDITDIYNNIGVCYERLNNHERSLENYQIVLNKRELLYQAKYNATELPQITDPTDNQLISDYADALRNVGAAYYRLGANYSKSESLFHQALELKKRIYGEKEPRENIINLYKDLTLTYEVLNKTKNSSDFKIKQLEMQLNFIKPTSQKELEEKADMLDELAIAYEKLEGHEQESFLITSKLYLYVEILVKIIQIWLSHIVHWLNIIIS
ncbi:MAG: tetratricopeptide repeat protein [Rickettsiales bacterium]|jgi:tetratricopeptide (TPR) repeat protein|nr:tetratricopeptide repeat protein [Rickettsiales bacterium]